MYQKLFLTKPKGKKFGKGADILFFFKGPLNSLLI